MSQSQIDILQRALSREKTARKSAEKILEDKSRELYLVSEKLKTNNEKLQDLLNEKSSQLKGVFNNILDAYLVMNLKGHVLEMNDAAKALFGYDIDQEKLNISSLIYTEDEGYAFNSFFELIDKGFFSNYRARVITKSKEIKWVQINASIIYDTDGRPISAQGIIRDITQDKEDEDLLVESKNRLSSLILNLDSGVLLEDENNKIVLTNTKFCELFKIPVLPELLIGEDCSNSAEDCKHLFKDPDYFIARIKELLKNKEQVLAEEVLMKDGTILERDFIPILKGNENNGHLWAYKDVSLKRKYRESLETQKNKYSNIIANMNLGLVETNKDGQILLVNQCLCEMSSYTEQELIGKKIDKLLPYLGAQEIIEDQIEKRLKGESNSYEIILKDKKRKRKNWLISGAPNYNLRGEIVGSIGICLDITEIKKLEQQKEKILKELEISNNELQEYAHIVSHDLKSPLRSINALTSWIKSDNKGKFDEVTLQNFDLIEITLEKMEQLISDILIYSSASAATTIPKEKVNLNSVLQDLKKILYTPNHINIRVLNELPVINGETIKFQQIFQNLLSNAIKFCDKENGLIEIAVLEKNSFYQFSVKDNGIGIEKKFHNKIFKIFHSLQASKDSTGIGLSIVKKIVELYKGEIWIESEPNIGTTFHFTIKK